MMLEGDLRFIGLGRMMFLSLRSFGALVFVTSSLLTWQGQVNGGNNYFREIKGFEEIFCLLDMMLF